MNLSNQLIDGKAKLGVWGIGYIGLTTMINFAQQGVYCVGYDVEQRVVDSLRKGEIHIPMLDYWMGYKPDANLMGMIGATSDWHKMLADDVKVHLIAIPTEKDGEPWGLPLLDVMSKIAKKTVIGSPDLVIIESTLTPGQFDKIVIKTLEDVGKVVGKDVLVGIAPRRDWFESPDKNLKNLARVIGGTDENTSQIMKEVLGIVCDNLIVADAHVVELVKSVENSILHICATYACQLASAYPEVNITEVLKLASTHWRIPLYYPSVGTGGYCIPLSSKYVEEGAPEPEHLGLTRETIRSDSEQPARIADMMVMKAYGGSIGILGLSYKGDLKVHTLSPVLGIIRRLKELNAQVKVFDPYYSGEEICSITGVGPFRYPEGLSEFTGLIIVPQHRLFGQTPKNVLFKYLREGQAILDNGGIWNKWRDDFAKRNIVYHRVGDAGWCSV